MSKLSEAVKDIEITTYRKADFKKMIADKEVQDRICEMLDNLEFQASAVEMSLAYNEPVMYFLMRIRTDEVFAKHGWTTPFFLRLDTRAKNLISAFHNSYSISNAKWFDEANAALTDEKCELTEFSVDETLYSNLLKYLSYKKQKAEDEKEAFQSTEGFEDALKRFRSDAL